MAVRCISCLYFNRLCASFGSICICIYGSSSEIAYKVPVVTFRWNIREKCESQDTYLWLQLHG